MIGIRMNIQHILMPHSDVVSTCSWSKTIALYVGGSLVVCYSLAELGHMLRQRFGGGRTVLN